MNIMIELVRFWLKVRQFAPFSCRLIEWGHKFSFAYISCYENSELDALARHIIVSKQLLFSSCQTILIDTSDFEKTQAFCLTFIDRFEKASQTYARLSLSEQAEITLQQYNSALEAIFDTSTTRDYRSEHCIVTLSNNHELKCSSYFSHIQVQMVPKSHLFQYLRGVKGYLQTVGLICSSEKRETITELLIKGGVTRITRGGDTSESFYGEAHAGRYPLAQYVRFIDCED